MCRRRDYWIFTRIVLEADSASLSFENDLIFPRSYLFECDNAVRLGHSSGEVCGRAPAGRLLPEVPWLARPSAAANHFHVDYHVTEPLGCRPISLPAEPDDRQIDAPNALLARLRHPAIAIGRWRRQRPRTREVNDLHCSTGPPSVASGFGTHGTRQPAAVASSPRRIGTRMPRMPRIGMPRPRLRRSGCPSGASDTAVRLVWSGTILLGRSIAL